jgi:hypothetical protein
MTRDMDREKKLIELRRELWEMFPDIAGRTRGALEIARWLSMTAEKIREKVAELEGLLGPLQ